LFIKTCWQTTRIYAIPQPTTGRNDLSNLYAIAYHPVQS